MNAILWDASLSVGDDTLDGEHRQLVKLINAVAGSGATFAEVFSALIDYTTQHFDHEEAFLEEIGYPELDRHRALHDGFVSRLSAMLRQHAEDAMAPADDSVAEWLWDWLKNHILVEDRKYADFARRSGP